MGDTGIGLHELLFERVVADPTLSSTSADLVLAAVESEEALTAVLNGGSAPPRADVAEGAEPDGPSGIYLRSIRAQGFRGVGPAAALDLQPGPGLTVVTGRNGSGKSSFAEAAELVLTGDNSRWRDRQTNKALWTQGWRNLHAAGPTQVEVDLVVQGRAGATTVRMSWDEGQALGEDNWTVQPHTGQQAGKREPVTAGWLPGIDVYRPFLSYGELGALLDKRPTELHEMLHGLLGLGVLDDARDRLKAARAPYDARAKAVKDAKQRLLAELASVDDLRARRVEELLGATRPDLDALAEQLLAEDADTDAIADLHAVVAIAVPTVDEVAAAGERIREADRQLAEVGTPDATSAGAVAALLQAALDHHSVQGDMRCPVCRTGTLDADWQAATAAEIARLNRDAAEFRAAHAAVQAAVEEARRLVTTVPAVLRRPLPVDTDAARRAWSTWEDARSAAPDELPEALRVAHAELTSAVDAVQAAAKQALVRLDETWRPVSSRLWAWHEAATASARDASTVTNLLKAESWLRVAAGELSDERMMPFATRSQEIWRQLRQESNVDLGGITLTGSGNQRRVLLDVTVDGNDTAALSVMSQGELHALGLSLFLPRATRDESPFRFVLIDDPVQAMDPAKVDGLARVLSEIAKDRQVIVFSHDDRLADAVRRLPDAAHVYEVQRGARSQVQVVPNHDPIRRYLSDARAVINDSDMPDDLRREIVANCCRGALEAAAHAKVRRVRLGRGDAHTDVDRALTDARTTHDKVTLAIFDDPARRRALLPHLALIGGWAADTLQACKQGAHGGLEGDLNSFVRSTRDLADLVLR
ncbi:RecF/RecN/SMC family protein [Pseudonocardia hierapolitana]|uniref:Nuclease SbcCD subunit C n=1 Tax=Pseudonocardia hierapolitana TaxID=1128676 RepID=A0A561SLB4_9PSEU|nr:AAA family ATPase [Pseudonocardia hierapolitana]TWF75643.1 RecF/RecN/SMC family protein [Pseudonocardia hierapolitana]